MAQIYLMTGEHDAAVEQLEFLLSVPSGVSAQALRTELTWEPLRNNARFQALLAKADSEASPTSQAAGN
jgi:hypothetical protein